MLQRTALLVMLCHFVMVFKTETEVLTLCPWFETDFLQNYKSVFK
jgi:hypothetical protein